MKKAIPIIGSLVFLFGVFNIIKYIFDYNVLAAYGKGFVWGNAILMLLGFFMMFFILKKKRRE